MGYNRLQDDADKFLAAHNALEPSSDIEVPQSRKIDFDGYHIETLASIHEIPISEQPEFIRNLFIKLLAHTNISMNVIGKTFKISPHTASKIAQ